MKLLVVNWQDRENPQSGGAETHLHEVFGRLASRGHDITLLCGGWPGCEPRTRLDGMNVHRIGTRYTFPLFARGYYDRKLRTEPADVLIEDINKVPLYTPMWGARRTVALVPHLFGTTVFTEAPAPLAALVWASELPLALFYKRVPFQAISRSTACDLRQRGVPESQIRIIYPGIDSDHFTPNPSMRSPTPLFAYLGRLKRYKGIDLVIRAFSGLQHASAELVIAGTGDDRERLKALARTLGLAARVHFPGFISEPDKLALLRRAWSFVLASPKEGWGITNLEAAACATPVVASDSPGLRESVRHEETGFLVAHGNVGAFSAALHRLAVSPDLVERLGAGARRFAEQFTWDATAFQTEEHLQSIVG